MQYEGELRKDPEIVSAAIRNKSTAMWLAAPGLWGNHVAQSLVLAVEGILGYPLRFRPSDPLSGVMVITRSGAIQLLQQSLKTEGLAADVLSRLVKDPNARRRIFKKVTSILFSCLLFSSRFSSPLSCASPSPSLPPFFFYRLRKRSFFFREHHYLNGPIPSGCPSILVRPGPRLVINCRSSRMASRDLQPCY